VAESAKECEGLRHVTPRKLKPELLPRQEHEPRVRTLNGKVKYLGGSFSTRQQKTHFMQRI